MKSSRKAWVGTRWQALAWIAIWAFLLGWFLSTIPNRHYLAQINAASKAATEMEDLLRGIKNVKVISVTPRLAVVSIRCEVETYDDHLALQRLLAARWPDVKMGLRCKVTDPFARKEGVASFQ